MDQSSRREPPQGDLREHHGYHHAHRATGLHVPHGDHVAFAPRRQPLPIVALAAACCLVGVWSVFSTGLLETPWQIYPLVLSGVLLGFISLFEIRVGLAVLLLAIGVSPEMSFFGVSNFRYEDLIFPILLFVWLTKHILNKERFAPTDLRTPILLLLFLALVSTLNNHIYGELDLQTAAFRYGKGVQYYFIFLIVLNSLVTKRDLKSFVWMLILASSVVGVYGLTQFGMYSGEFAYRVTGPPGETANILGGYYVFHICIAMGLLTMVPAAPRFLLYLYVAVMLVPFIGTLSRTSYVALAVGLFVIWLISRNKALAWVLLMITFFALLAPDSSAARFWSIFGVFTGEGPSSWVARVDGWQLFLGSTMEAPLLGQGVGRSELGALDNEYVLQMHEIGIIGLVAFIWLISKCLRTSKALMRFREGTTQDRVLQGFTLGYFGGLVALLVHSIGATTFTTIRTTEPFFFATGLLYSYWNLTKKSDHHHGSTPVSEGSESGQRVGRVELPKPDWLIHAEKNPQRKPNLRDSR